jgi:hypothetical protein
MASPGPAATPTSRLYPARRKPERPWIDTIRIQLQHLVVELSHGRRRLGQAVEIADVLPGLFNDPGTIVVSRPLVSGSPGDALSTRGTNRKRNMPILAVALRPKGEWPSSPHFELPSDSTFVLNHIAENALPA